MQISGSGPPSQFTLRLSPQAASSLPLRQGDTLTAVVTQSDPSGKLTLEINGRLLQALSTLRLTAGTTLQLQVEKQNGQLVLRLTERDMQQLAHQQALRQTLPRQQSLKPVLEQIVQMQSDSRGSVSAEQAAQPARTEGKSTDGADLSSTQGQLRSRPDTTAVPVEKAISRLIAILPTLSRLSSGEGMQQAIARSGLFLEHSLLQGAGSSVLQGDVKNALLRLARSIRQGLSEGSSAPRSQGGETAKMSPAQMQSLLRQVESGLARIQLHQLNTLVGQVEGEERPVINLELPLFHPQTREIDLLRLQIQRDKDKRKSGNGNDWSVSLHLSPADYGEIHALVTLAGGRISTTFWCEQEQTGQLFRRELEQLQQRLNEQGLEVGRCTALVGKPPEEAVPATATSINGLIDTRV